MVSRPNSSMVGLVEDSEFDFISQKVSAGDVSREQILTPILKAVASLRTSLRTSALQSNVT